MQPELKEDFIREIEQLKINNRLIIVEGKKDSLALKEFGINNIIQLSKKSIPSIIDEISNEEEIIILTDLDKEGKKLYGKLNSGLQKQGVKINNKFRNFLYKETKLRNIEGLKHYQSDSQQC